MAVWLPPTTYSTGNPLPATSWNVVANDVLFLYQAPYAISGNTTPTSLVANTGTTIPITTVTSNYGFSISSGGFEIPINGVYHADFSCADGDTGSGIITPILSVNGGVVLFGQGGVNGNTGFGATGHGSGTISVMAGEIVVLGAIQTNGATQTSISNPLVTFLHLYFVGSQ